MSSAGGLASAAGTSVDDMRRSFPKRTKRDSDYRALGIYT
jgi:hypothetical protein